ncbi:uncharacterized protein LOC129609719 [Condylostylus longicornis]|uniref:uncharacterized protein LOC129609719 n=1 Tax=Condylostylus longicornis TaxID=2530218 RepID=UPI00244E5A3C|nr:uncharacterized protein LOC129609719 [Condylostylus longicornis]
MKSILFGCLLLIISVSANDKPSFFNPCSMNDADTSSCVAENIERIIKLGKNGFELQDIPAIDPVFIDSAQTPDSSAAVTLKQKFTNFTFSGVSDMKIIDIKTNFVDKCQIKVKNSLPKAIIKGDYEANGRLLLFQVQGADKFEVIMNKIKVGTIINCEFYEKDNEKYFKILNIKFQLRPENGHMSFPNIIHNNKELSQTVNDLLNENFLDIFNEFKSTIQEKLEEKFSIIANKIIGDHPVKELFKVE